MKIPARFFLFICPLFILKDVRSFSAKQIKCWYLHKINEKSRAGINGYFYIENPLFGKNDEQWKYHFFTQKFVEMAHF